MKKILILLTLIFCSVLLFSEIRLYNEPVVTMTYGDPLIVELEVRNGLEEIKEIKLYYREQGQLTYQEMEQDMESVSQTTFTFRADEAATYQSAVEYFFQVTSKTEQNFTLPEQQAQIIPYVVAISQPITSEDSGFVLLSPDEDFSEGTKNYVIAISYFAVQDRIDLNSIQLLYDGEDVTVNAEIYSNMLIYKVQNSKGGMHMYKVSASMKNGKEIESETWKTKVSTSSFKQTLNLSGKSVANTYLSSQSFANADSLNDDDKRANWLLQFGGKYGWVGFKSKLYLSSLEDHNKQAVNRYNIALTSPYFDLTAGDYTPNYGTFLMSGKNVNGIHARLHTPMFSLKITSGKIKRAINGNLAANRGASFTRNSFSVKSELGNSTFLWGLGFTKNKDDMESVDENLRFTSTGGDLTPNDNIILGTDFALSLFRRRLMWGAELAMSYFNSNITDGALSLEEIEDEFDTTIDLPFDPADFEDIFVANQFMQPFKPGPGNMAYKTYLRLFFYQNFLSFSYSAVGGSFNSLSSNFLQKDTSTLSVNDNISLIGNKLFLNLGLNMIADNLNDEKESTTKTMNYNTTVYYRPTPISFIRFGYYNSSTTKDDNNASSLAMDITNASINFGVGYTVEQIKAAPTEFSIGYNNSANEANSIFETGKNNIVLSAKSDFEELPLETVVSYTLSMDEKQSRSAVLDSLGNEVDWEKTESTYNSLYLKGSLSFMDDKLKPFIDLQFAANGGDADNSSTRMNLGSSYYLYKNTFFSTNIGTKFYANGNNDASDYSLFDWRFKFTQKF